MNEKKESYFLGGFHRLRGDNPRRGEAQVINFFFRHSVKASAFDVVKCISMIYEVKEMAV